MTHLNNSTSVDVPSIETLQRLVDSVPKPDFNSIVVSRKAFDAILESANAKQEVVTEGQDMLLHGLGVPVFFEDVAFERLGMAMRRDVPTPTLLELCNGDFVVFDPSEFEA